MKLVIVESPTKAKTIGQFLGKGYHVESSYGHVRDLPKSKLGIDTDANFEPSYVVPKKAKPVVAELKKRLKDADEVILATDEDREGEAIAWHLAHALGLVGPKVKGKPKPIERIVFHEITKTAIQNALEHPRQIDDHLVDAQQARRVLDRIVGYKLSPFLWKKVAGGLSAGRVQSVALRLIVEREHEIRAFKPEEYWTISATLGKQDDPNVIFEALLVKVAGESLEKFALKNTAAASAVADDLSKAAASVASIETKSITKSPLAPFTTSTLQQEGVKRLRYSAKKTMLLAQHLYERGLITYMRTDSVNLSKESTAAAKAWLAANFGAEYATEAPRSFTSKSKLAQEAHEAIRPTDVSVTPGNLPAKEEAERRLYQLIWSRFLASQMPHAKVATTTIDLRAVGKKEYTLRAKGQRIVFDGYLKVWPQKLEEREVPELREAEALAVREVKPSQHFTEPPPRYSEASLVKTLEEYGIGRPSTYAPTISVIQTRGYVEKDAGRFKPTEVGELVHKVLTENFEEIVDLRFTAAMEDELDEIARGAVSWRGVIADFYGPFAKKLAEKYEAVTKESLMNEKTDEVCPKCGKPMVMKMSRFGKFLGCSGFPECKGTKKLESGAAKEPPKLIGMKCPKCSEGDIVERKVNRGRARGKVFWGCSRYPKCDYASWDDPRLPPPEKGAKKPRRKTKEENEELPESEGVEEGEAEEGA
jgi:DNA topoisomerase-1